MFLNNLSGQKSANWAKKGKNFQPVKETPHGLYLFQYFIHTFLNGRVVIPCGNQAFFALLTVPPISVNYLAGYFMKKSEVLREVSKQKQLLNGNAIREIMMYGKCAVGTSKSNSSAVFISAASLKTFISSGKLKNFENLVFARYPVPDERIQRDI